MTAKLLLVDDEPRNLKLLEGWLAPLGYQLDLATGGVEALARFAESPPDLVLLDVRMADLDGIEVLKRIRIQEAPGQHTPIILVTAHTDREHRLRGVHAGADEFLEKPIDGTLLIARVRGLLKLREASNALAARNDALELLQREQRELMGFIVHDLKNPLSVSWSNLDWVKNVLHADAPVIEALDEARDGLRRLKAMIDDLLVVSRLEEARFPVRTESVSIAELLADVLRVYRRLADEKQVEMTFPDELDLHANADRTLLRRVFENILDNALRYTPRNGRVAIATSLTGDVEVAVCNTGPGIAIGDRGRIFEKFARGAVEGERPGNAGLGLYFCKRAVEAFGGGIELVENPEWPTSFVVRLQPS